MTYEKTFSSERLCRTFLQAKEMSAFLRSWNRYSLDNVAKELLLIAQGSVICFSCKHIDAFDRIRATYSCPSCKTAFNYFAFKNTDLDVRYLDKVREAKPQAIFIDLNDFQREFNKKKAKDFFQ